MFCSNCGKENIDTAKFCIACGKNLVMPKEKVKDIQKKYKPIKLIMFSGVFVVVLLIISFACWKIFFDKGVIIEDPLVERCIRETLGKDIDDKITEEECASITSLLIDCQYDISFTNDTASNYVDLCDLRYLTGLEELYIDNNVKVDYLANMDVITNCKELEKLCMQYNPIMYYSDGEVGRGYKYLLKIIEQLPELEYLDLGYFVPEQYKELLSQYHDNLFISDGENDCYIDNRRVSVQNVTSGNICLVTSVDEYTEHWKYEFNSVKDFYNTDDTVALAEARKLKIGLKVSSEEELNRIVEELPEDTEDLFLKVSLNVLDMSVFEKFDDLKTLSIIGRGKSEGYTEIKNLEVLQDLDIYSWNIKECKGDFEALSNSRSLKELSIVSCEVTSLDFLNRLKNLRELTLLRNEYSDENQAVWENDYGDFEKLKFLRIQDSNSLAGVKDNNSIETISLWGPSEKFTTFEYVSECESLKHLLIVYGNVEGIDMSPLEKLTGLETISVPNYHVSNIESVLQLPNIVSIVVGDLANGTGYFEAINDSYDEAAKNENLSCLDTFASTYSEIDYFKLYEANICGGAVQTRMHILPEDNLSFEEAYEAIFDIH